MILTAHILAGAATASVTGNYWLAGLFGFLSHFVLDFLPHKEYDIENLKQGKFSRRFWIDGAKVLLDILIGFSLVFYFILFYQKKMIILIGAALGILPDFFSFLSYFFPVQNHLALIGFLHKKVHFLENKKINFLTKVFTQTAVIAVALWSLR